MNEEALPGAGIISIQDSCRLCQKHVGWRLKYCYCSPQTLHAGEESERLVVVSTALSFFATNVYTFLRLDSQERGVKILRSREIVAASRIASIGELLELVLFESFGRASGTARDESKDILNSAC